MESLTVARLKYQARVAITSTCQDKRNCGEQEVVGSISNRYFVWVAGWLVIGAWDVILVIRVIRGCDKAKGSLEIDSDDLDTNGILDKGSTESGV